MSAKYDARVVVERFVALRECATTYSSNRTRYNELELHDAALKYAAAVRKVARAGRNA